MEAKTAGLQPTITKWLQWGTNELAFLGEREAREECERILEALFQTPRTQLYLETNPRPETLPEFLKWVQARKERVPLAYLQRRAFFWEDEFEVDEGVFIPRPETETLIEAFLEHGGFSKNEGFRFLDLGTGSANIAGTIARLFPRSKGVAADLSEKAARVARRNAGGIGVGERLEIVQVDGLSAFKKESFDVVFSNPPYVATGEWPLLDLEVLREPRLALDGGGDGLDFYRIIFQGIGCLKAGGSLWVEVGWGQASKVRSLFEKGGFGKISTFRDLNGVERVIGAFDRNG